MKRDSESDLDYFYRLKAENAAEERRRLEEARRNSGKEEFDGERLENLLRPLLPTIPRREQLEYSYYVVCSKVRTLEEFASFLQEADLYDGGDMHLDRD